MVGISSIVGMSLFDQHSWPGKATTNYENLELVTSRASSGVGFCLKRFCSGNMIFSS